MAASVKVIGSWTNGTSFVQVHARRTQDGRWIVEHFLNTFTGELTQPLPLFELRPDIVGELEDAYQRTLGVRS
jgi:hypothetical protein